MCAQHVPLAENQVDRMFLDQFRGGDKVWNMVIGNERLRDELRRKRREMNEKNQRVPERTFYARMRLKWKPPGLQMDFAYEDQESMLLVQFNHVIAVNV